MVGSLTPYNFCSPELETQNWRVNLLYYMYNDVCTKIVTVGGYANLTENTTTQKMYPNPAQNVVNLVLSPTTFVEIYSVSGQRIISPTLDVKILDVSQLESGIYLVVFTDENGTSTQKLTIN